MVSASKVGIQYPEKELEKAVPNPGAPRKNVAPSVETPQPKSSGKKSVLEAHLSYFDSGNGVIYPLDTFRGFHSLGFNVVLSTIAIFVIHGTFSYWTLESWIPDLRFPIIIKNIDRCKHGSDSETYDTEGNYVPQKFEETFSKYAKTRKDALNAHDILGMLKGNRNVLDPTGWTAAALEWYALWWIAKDEEGFLTKERARQNFDGSLWPILAEENKQRKLAKRKSA